MSAGQVLLAVATIAAGYFIGGIPFGVVVARVLGGPDPRTLGSGRTGGANVLRALGPVPALVSGLLDTAKGAVTVLIAMSLGVGPTIEVLAALASIIGHSRSPYIGFNGGRGVAPAWGALLVFQPVIALGVVPMFLAVVAITRISSLASLTTSLVAAVALLAAVVLLAMPTAYAGYAVGAAAIVWLFHADNIRRLITGEERRIEWPRSRGG